MLKNTPEEIAYLADFDASAARINAEIAAFRDLPRLSYQASDEERAERAAEEKRVTDLRDAHNARQQDPIAVKIALKNEVNTFITEKIPGGEAGALIEVANEILAALTTDETAVGAARLLKSAVVLGLDAINDADIHAARARGIFARYTALVATGLPEDFVRQIMIAEAARAIPMPSMSRNKR